MDLTNQILDAAKRIEPHIRKTYFHHSRPFSTMINGSVWFKLENIQLTGSFKVRGAMNKILSLKDSKRSKGVIAASTGNHGAAVAFAAGRLNIDCTIYVPDNSSKAKIDNMRNYGSRVKVYGSDCIESELKARQASSESGKPYVSPYNDLDVIAGQGTIGVEIESQCDRLDALIVSVGGGGLIGGIGSYLKSIWPELIIIGCSPENSAVMIHSMRKGRLLSIDSKPTLSDGTAGGIEQDSITFPICRSVIDETILLEEKEIRDAMNTYMKNENQLLEGAAGTAVAALIRKKEELMGKKVGVLICGGNISPDTLRSVLI